VINGGDLGLLGTPAISGRSPGHDLLSRYQRAQARRESFGEHCPMT